jgi:hypothetical protein
MQSQDIYSRPISMLIKKIENQIRNNKASNLNPGYHIDFGGKLVDVVDPSLLDRIISVVFDIPKTQPYKEIRNNLISISDDPDNFVNKIKAIVKGNNIISISFIDFLEYVPFPERILENINSTFKSSCAPIYVIIPNITHINTSLHLFAGRFGINHNYDDVSKEVSFFDEQRLGYLFKAINYGLFEKLDEKSDHIDSSNCKSDTLLLENTLLNKYLKSIKSEFDPNYEVIKFVRIYISSPINLNNQVRSPSFLTVVIRTQGKRLESLREALLCMFAQIDQDFEIIVMGHKIDKFQISSIEKLIDEQPMSLKKKIKFYYINYGNRATPLNEAFSLANSEYISIFDDDDLVFDNWVDTFHKGHMTNNGNVLHSYILKQDWSMVNKNGKYSMTSVDAPSTIYFKNFDWEKQYEINYCPAHSLAFPTYAFNNLGIRFDESLSTTEDWDFLMRTVEVCGVFDIQEATGIYRIWIDAENSSSLHSKEEWNENYKKIKKKMEERRLTNLVYNKNTNESSRPIETSIIGVEPIRQIESIRRYYSEELLNAFLYLDFGVDFSENEKIKPIMTTNSEFFILEYSLDQRFSHINRFRWDPLENENCIISNLSIKFVLENGSIVLVDKDLITTNAFVSNGFYVFGNEDPQIVFKKNQKIAAKRIIIEGMISNNLERVVRLFYKQSLYFRAKRWIKRHI